MRWLIWRCPYRAGRVSGRRNPFFWVESPHGRSFAGSRVDSGYDYQRDSTRCCLKVDCRLWTAYRSIFP